MRSYMNLFVLILAASAVSSAPIPPAPAPTRTRTPPLADVAAKRYRWNLGGSWKSWPGEIK
jgi:hypothetical protein